MKTELILVGKTTDSLFAKAIADYAGRIAHSRESSLPNSNAPWKAS